MAAKQKHRNAGNSYNLSELHASRHDRSVQDQVEARIRQLSEVDARGMDPKYKLQWGSSVDIYVK